MTILKPSQDMRDVAGAMVQQLPIDVALISNYITRHQLPVYESVQRKVKRLRVLISVAMEPQRDYSAQFGDLQVSIQNTITLKRTWNHDAGFRDPLYVHVPWDTYFQLTRSRPKVIVSYELGTRSLLSAFYRRLHPRVRLVTVVNASEHTERSWGASRRRIRPWILRTSDIVTYNGPSCKRYLLSAGVPEEKLFLGPYAAHANSIHRGSTERCPASRRKLLHVGQLTERKNVLFFVRLLSHWCQQHPDESVHLSLVGRGPQHEAIASLERPSNFQIAFLGPIDPSDMPKVWAEHGVLVFPTLADEWGMVVNEALHSGLPVLGSVFAQSSITLIKEGENGWLFVPNRKRDTLAAIGRMMNTPSNQLNQMAMSARESVKDRTAEWAGIHFVDAIRAAWNKQ